MPTIINDIKEGEKREKEEAIDLLRRQMAVEAELVRLYEETAGDIKSTPVRHLLHMIQFDSRKHIDICQTVIEVLQGEDILKPEREELITGLQRHIELEKESINRANRILENFWIRDTKGLRELVKKLRKDEKEHHKALRKLAGKTFFREDPFDFYGLFRDTEERYIKYERKKKTQ